MNDSEKNDSSASRIFHVALSEDLQRAEDAGEYVCDSLRGEGFIHCCLSSQLSGVLERYFSDVTGYTVVEIDVAKLPAKLKPVFENTVGGTELFPHVYGPLPLDCYKPEAA